MPKFRDRNGDPIEVGDWLTWLTATGETARGQIIAREPWMGHDALWVRLPDAHAAPLLTRDTPHMTREPR